VAVENNYAYSSSYRDVVVGRVQPENCPDHTAILVNFSCSSRWL